MALHTISQEHELLTRRTRLLLLAPYMVLSSHANTS